MPRLPPSLLRRAHTLSPLLPLILQGTRTLDSAVNELRWLREHVNSLIPRPRGSQQEKSNGQPRPHQAPDSAQQARDRQKILVRLCKRRARSEPLQYILGSQPFGTLDIRCRRGVLIPRPETEAYTAHLAKLLLGKKLHPALLKPSGRTKKTPLRILDLCSGSGCIALLLHCLLKARKPYLAILGLDISPNAISLSRQNLRHNMRLRLLSRSARKHVQFRQCDIFSPSLLSGNLWESGADATKEKAAEDGMERGEETVEERIEEREEEREEEKREWEVDIIISNPPYISQRAFDTETTRSVRNWEPRLALLPSVASTRTGVDQHAGNGAEKVCKRIGNVDLEDEDIFFVRLMAIHDLRNSKVCVMEVGDEEQAERVVALYNHLPLARHNSIEFWRDHPSSPPAPGDEIIKFHKPGGHLVPFPVRGAGKIRAVVILRDEFMPRHRHARERYVSERYDGERYESERHMNERNMSRRHESKRYASKRV